MRALGLVPVQCRPPEASGGSQSALPVPGRRIQSLVAEDRSARASAVKPDRGPSVHADSAVHHHHTGMSGRQGFTATKAAGHPPQVLRDPNGRSDCGPKACLGFIGAADGQQSTSIGTNTTAKEL
jgi:hypothetical protein